MKELILYRLKTLFGWFLIALPFTAVIILTIAVIIFTIINSGIKVTLLVTLSGVALTIIIAICIYWGAKLICD